MVLLILFIKLLKMFLIELIWKVKINQGNNLKKGRVDVQKNETNESIIFIFENGVIKKVTKVVKYMSDGEIKNENYKANLIYFINFKITFLFVN